MPESAPSEKPPRLSAAALRQRALASIAFLQQLHGQETQLNALQQARTLTLAQQETVEIVKTFEAQQVTAERLATEASMHEAYKDKVAKETEAVRNQVKASMEATIALEKKEKRDPTAQAQGIANVRHDCTDRSYIPARFCGARVCQGRRFAAYRPQSTYGHTKMLLPKS